MQGEHGESKKMAIYKLRKVHAKKYTMFSPRAEGGICGLRCECLDTDFTPGFTYALCLCVCVCTKSLQSCSTSGFLTTSAAWEDLFMPHSLFSICFIFLILSSVFFFLIGIQLLYIVALVSTVVVLDVSLSAA